MMTVDRTGSVACAPYAGAGYPYPVHFGCCPAVALPSQPFFVPNSNLRCFCEYQSGTSGHMIDKSMPFVKQKLYKGSCTHVSHDDNAFASSGHGMNLAWSATCDSTTWDFVTEPPA
ncbi:putative DNA primase [Pseudomonas phage phiGM22-3]|uniref:Putative DNA primase n=1 Tax=Pseudomonas phage phiGM22-3 TaxID=2816462 RepID=A0A8T8IVL2_9CAUD|nr:putative DNA primase [Pseudomonas phage phiGM22-3]